MKKEAHRALPQLAEGKKSVGQLQEKWPSALCTYLVLGSRVFLFEKHFGARAGAVQALQDNIRRGPFRLVAAWGFWWKLDSLDTRSCSVRGRSACHGARLWCPERRFVDPRFLGVRFFSCVAIVRALLLLHTRSQCRRVSTSMRSPHTKQNKHNVCDLLCRGGSQRI